ARAGVEMAVIDAVANSIRIPLWRLFGGASNTVTTDMTVWLSKYSLQWVQHPYVCVIKIAKFIYF
uniref:Uncharacterized protein n=1 Tax=Aegilops tauschii subsp. strangulata TaxID=200361 RepID=A0A453DV25_AEGTS